MWEYTDAVRDHFFGPRNAGELPDANAIGEVGSLACGDALKLYLKIDADSVITDAKFQTFGCASAIASSSVLTEMLKGKTVDEALQITNRDIVEQLGGLPKEKMHCSVMGQEALEAAIANWRGQPVGQAGHRGQLVCACFGVTDEQILRAISENKLTSVEDVTNYTKAGGACGRCRQDIQRLLDDVPDGGPADEIPAAEVRPKLTNVQRMQMIMQILDRQIRPSLQRDGGDIELVDVDGNEVTVALRGMCINCPSSRVTIDGFVQNTLRELVDPDIVVRQARP